MKKFFISIVAVILVVCSVLFSACAQPVGVPSNKTYNELDFKVYYKLENSKIILPIKHKRIDFGGVYMKLKTTTDNETLYEELKKESTFIEEHNDSLLFLAKGESYNYPQYVSISYEGINKDDSKYYDYFVEHQFTDYTGAGDTVRLSFPLLYIAKEEGARFGWIKSDPVKVNCTFDQLKAYYERLEYCFVSATEDCVTIKGYVSVESTGISPVYEDRVLLIKYDNGTVTVSSAE